jgi:hypothetical protein
MARSIVNETMEAYMGRGERGGEEATNFLFPSGFL